MKPHARLKNHSALKCHRLIVRSFWLIVFAGLWLAPAFGQENTECLGCHSDKSLEGTRKGKKFSVFVDEKKFGQSMHAALTCVSCHADLAGKELPHAEGLQKVECGTCHSAEQELHTKSLHGKAIARGDALAPHCNDCHGSHNILERSAFAYLAAPDSIPVWEVPPGRIAGDRSAHDSPGSYSGELL
jgi:hypothetical protein